MPWLYVFLDQLRCKVLEQLVALLAALLTHFLDVDGGRHVRRDRDVNLAHMQEGNLQKDKESHKWDHWSGLLLLD